MRERAIARRVDSRPVRRRRACAPRLRRCRCWSTTTFSAETRTPTTTKPKSAANERSKTNNVFASSDANFTRIGAALCSNDDESRAKETCVSRVCCVLRVCCWRAARGVFSFSPPVRARACVLARRPPARARTRHRTPIDASREVAAVCRLVERVRRPVRAAGVDLRPPDQAALAAARGAMADLHVGQSHQASAGRS